MDSSDAEVPVAANVVVTMAAELAVFLPTRRRPGPVRVGCDGVSSLGHVVESIGVPLTEVGGLVVNGETAISSYRPCGGEP